MLQRFGIVVASLLMLTACPQQELFVVLPNADGTPGSGAISIDDGKTKTTLDRAFAAGEIRQDASAAIDVPKDDTRIIFNQAVGARPILPHRFTLYFELASDELTPQSQLDYRAILEDLKPRKAYEIQTIGFTDTLGTPDYNQDLSIARALAIRNKLIGDGVAANAISVTGRGQFGLAVPTGDQVAEPLNRRVDVLVR